MKHTFLRITFSLFVFSALAVTLACGKEADRDTNADIEPKFRVLGYLYTSGSWSAALEQIDLTAITDLNLAFINPNASGTFDDDGELGILIGRAKEANVRVFLSIGGGSPPSHLAGLLTTAESRAKLVDGILEMLKKYDFAGVDIDLENELIDANYPDFVSRVARAVKPTGRLVTAALASWNSNLISDETLAHYDFINVMSYDATGPWNLNNPGPHSPYEMAVNDFNYYHETRGIPADRLFVGLPFYGYGFGEGVPGTMVYRDIVQQWPDLDDGDEVAVAAGGSVFFNGTATIRKKTQFAIDKKAGGVMIWQLLQDAKGDRSLLRAINNTIENQ